MFLKYLGSTDHTHIGLLYGITSLFFLLVGFCLVPIIRWQLAYPGEPVPYVGGVFGEAAAPGGIITNNARKPLWGYRTFVYAASTRFTRRPSTTRGLPKKRPR